MTGFDWIEAAEGLFDQVGDAPGREAAMEAIGESQAAALIAIAHELRKLNERLEMVTDETSKCVQVFAWTQEN